MNPNNEKHMKRLTRAVDWSKKRLEPYRDHRRKAVKAYLGNHYNDTQLNAPCPDNQLAQSINIYMRYLFGGSPQVLVTAKEEGKPYFADMFSKAMTGLMEKMSFGEKVCDIVGDSLFSPMGISKTGLQQPRKIDPDRPGAGDPFTERVDFDDWFHDMAASRWSEVEYCGDEYLLPLDMVKDAERFDKKVRNKLEPDELGVHEPGGGERVDELGEGGKTDIESISDQIKMRDIWLAREQQLVVVAVQHPDEPLEVIDWAGPSNGPYDRLYYFSIPGKTLPLPPVAQLVDLNMITNQLFTKAVDAALHEKDVVGVGREAKEDADRMMASPNFETVVMDRPDLIKRIQVGGLSQSALAMWIQSAQLFNARAGNLDALGGLSPGAETLGQDQMLTETASRLVNHMQQRVIDFVRRICRDLTWYLWFNQNGPISILRDLGSNRYVKNFTADFRVGGYFDYLYDIAPYTMQSRTPKQRMAQVMQWLQQVILPAAPMFAQSGKTLDAGKLLELIQTYDDLPELGRLLTKIDPEMMDQMGAQQQVQKSPVSRRTYERINRPGRTRQAADYAMTQAMMGKGVQNSEMEAAAR